MPDANVANSMFIEAVYHARWLTCLRVASTKSPIRSANAREELNHAQQALDNYEDTYQRLGALEEP